LVADLRGRTDANVVTCVDLLSTIPYIAGETMALKYSRTKKMTEFTKDELKHLAVKARIVIDCATTTTICVAPALW
jgi:hypothetical protein